jgi:A/G-specific adenine glycosylase
MTLAARTAPRKRAAPRSPAAPRPADLLAWYDRNRRTLPWRVAPGERADPYRVWLSEIMLQQTTVKAVAPYFARFTERWRNVQELAAAPLEDVLKLWAGLGYYARARNLHACARTLAERHGGRFPAREADLRALPGIGRYTAAAIAAIAFGARTAAVDGNVERVIARLFAVEDALPAAKPVIRGLTDGLVPAKRAGDFAQALMDLGATICTPRRPACALCPWMACCAGKRRGDAETFPRKARKRERRLRRGAAFVVTRNGGAGAGAVLVRARPPSGLLGGMTEVPTSEWTHAFDASCALATAPRFTSGKSEIAWRRVPGVVTHVFTHFPLELIVYVGEVPAATSAPPRARWVPLAQLGGEALPNLMRKVIAHAIPEAAAAGFPARRQTANQMR